MRAPAAQDARPAGADAAGAVPADARRQPPRRASTQQALGRFLLDLSRVAPEVAARVVTVSPDVASSTNLGGWINRVGMWTRRARRLVRRRRPACSSTGSETRHGQHIELGIAEVNLVGLLGELGSTWSRDGQPLLPIGTLYDPFVTPRARAVVVRIYSGGQSILVGTPSGVTLAPEGGATSRSSRLRSGWSSRAAPRGSRLSSRTSSGPFCTP